MRGLVSAIVVALALFAKGASADFTWSGVGTFSCSRFSENYRAIPKDIRNITVSWMQGFFSGMNAPMVLQQKQTKDISPRGYAVDEQFEDIVRYCHNNPESSVVFGVLQVWDDFPMNAE